MRCSSVFFRVIGTAADQSRRPQGPGKVDELLGVIGAPRAELHHVVVAGALTFRTQAVEAHTRQADETSKRRSPGGRSVENPHPSA